MKVKLYQDFIGKLGRNLAMRRGMDCLCNGIELFVMVSKTRDRLIEVARQLFVRKGVENTTMLDIANASDKGRRTIYTYFKSKREIHQAVIERESEQIVQRQRQIQTGTMPAAEKLEQFLWARYEIMQCPTSQKSRDIIPILNLLDGSRSGRTRKLAVQKMVEILQKIVQEGVENGEFDASQAPHITPVVMMIMQGFDNAASAEQLEQMGSLREQAFRHIVDFVLKGIVSKEISALNQSSNAESK